MQPIRHGEALAPTPLIARKSSATHRDPIALNLRNWGLCPKVSAGNPPSLKLWRVKRPLWYTYIYGVGQSGPY